MISLPIASSNTNRACPEQLQTTSLHILQFKVCPFIPIVSKIRTSQCLCRIYSQAEKAYDGRTLVDVLKASTMDVAGQKATKEYG